MKKADLIERKIRQIVDNDIYCDVTDMVAYILEQCDENAPCAWEDVTHYNEKNKYQWFIVSNILAEKLSDEGEVILWSERNTMWGRSNQKTEINLYDSPILNKIAASCFR